MYPRRWTLASRNQPHDFGRLDYSTESHVFVVERGSLSNRRISRAVWCTVRELVHRGLCTGSRLTLTSCTVPLYCLVVLYRRPPVVLIAVRLLLAYNVRSQLYCCTAHASGKQGRLDKRCRHFSLFTVPLLVLLAWSSYPD